jgi:hypothetical protein
MADTDWQALAHAVKKRRLALGLTATAAAGAAGINRVTWAAIEAGNTRLTERLWAPIERALAWTSGSIAAVLAGGEPTESPARGEAPAVGPAKATAMDLAAEVERIKGLDLAADAKIRLVRAIVELYEQQQRERTHTRT